MNISVTSCFVDNSSVAIFSVCFLIRETCNRALCVVLYTATADQSQCFARHHVAIAARALLDTIRIFVDFRALVAEDSKPAQEKLCSRDNFEHFLEYNPIFAAFVDIITYLPIKKTQESLLVLHTLLLLVHAHRRLSSQPSFCPSRVDQFIPRSRSSALLLLAVRLYLRAKSILLLNLSLESSARP